ncbi:uncharacterized protein C17orf113-like [Ruditapes philippinarum]|uniref:uncharacterized protein C17orf113-like n=1 Tax=Ruditapes philippinarum TaxID=129788 RepID=UPI00295A7D80|nr:uncharacterized protein C17orf113-like [Ruditapes philippinarum]
MEMEECIEKVRKSISARSFVGNEQITDCTGAGIESALLEFLVRTGISNDNLMNVLGLGTDVAAVMTGCLNGLGAKLKARNNKLLQLSVEAAVKIIFSNYGPVYQSLESDKTAGKADGLLKFIANAKFLLFTALLIDVLTVIGILSLTFQKDLVNISHIRASISATKATLETMKTRSETVSKVLSEVGDIPEPGKKNKYQQLEVTDNQQTRDEFSNLRQTYIDTLTLNLNNRFPEDQLQTLECFDIVLNPKRYPDQAGDLPNYGNDQLSSLLSFYDTLVNSERAKSHFLMFKHFVRSQKALTFDSFIKLLINEYEDEFPDFVLLGKIAMIIPVSSAPCERGFSVQNALKNKVRNRLNASRLNRLMFIKLIGPPIEHLDFLPAAKIFAEGAQGRL